VVLDGKDAYGRRGGIAIVRAPRSLPRIIQIPEKVSGGKDDYVFLSAVLTEFVADLFPGMKVKGAYQFRVTRNSELFVDEEEVENIASALKDELHARGYNPAVRLEIAKDCPDRIVQILLQNFKLSESAVSRIKGPVNLNRVVQVYDLAKRPDLKFPCTTLTRVSTPLSTYCSSPPTTPMYWQSSRRYTGQAKTPRSSST
jgi:polyphosphate kinase